MKFFVVRGTEVFQEIQRPFAAIAPRRIERRLNPQGFARNDGKQIAAKLQSLKLLIIINTGQVEPVYLFVLQQKRFVRWLEHRIPTNAMKTMHSMVTWRNHRSDCKRLAAQGQSGEKNDSLLLNLHWRIWQRALRR